MSAPPVLGFDDVEAILRRLPRDARNPTGGAMTCLYTALDDRHRHCIVGQIWACAGLPVPGPHTLATPIEIAEDTRTVGWYAPGLLDALRDLQVCADRWEGDAPVAWAAAIDAWPEIRLSWEEEAQRDAA